MAVVQIADVIVPETFTGYSQQITEQKSRLIQSGAIVRDSQMDALLEGAGLTYNIPSWEDLANDEDNVSSDDDTVQSAPRNTGTGKEIGVRLSRNNSWSSMALAKTLAGSDPVASITNRVGYYWTRRLQAAFVATVRGMFANNALASPGGGAVQNDLTNDVSGSSYTAGTTDFNASAFLDAILTIGDSAEDLRMLMVHSVVFNRMQKNNLVDFIPDSTGVVQFATYQGKAIVIDDNMPFSGGVYESWIFGEGALRLGVGTPDVPTEVKRDPARGNGGGQETLWNRVEWMIHPTGHKFAVASPASGGPNNTAASGNLAHSASWQRVFPERKQIKVARLITREHA